MIQMSVCQKHIQGRGSESVLHAEKTGTGIQCDADLRQQQTGRVAAFIRMVATGAKKDELHGESDVCGGLELKEYDIDLNVPTV